MNNNPTEGKLMDHEADGIKELDNLLPRWWVWLFNLSIAFAVVYLIYYHVAGAGDLQAAEYTKEWKRGEELKSAAIAKFESGIATLTPSTDKAVLGDGQRLFVTYCAPCHRPDGGGLVGGAIGGDGGGGRVFRSAPDAVAAGRVRFAGLVGSVRARADAARHSTRRPGLGRGLGTSPTGRGRRRP